MQIIFETRFSYFGQSGWRSDASRDPGQLFEPARLESRLDLFRRITLPSLAGQRDDDFLHIVLSSDDLPEPQKRKLELYVTEALGERAEVIYRPFGSAGHMFRDRVIERFGKQANVAQVVLDDDDALSNDYVSILRYHGLCVLNDPFRRDAGTFLSFPRGYTLGLEEGEMRWLEPRNVPFTNLGLASVAPAWYRKNPYLTAHKRIGERLASHVIGAGRPFYLRAVHEHNDSRAIAGEERLSDEQIAEVFEYFPFLEPEFSHLSRTVA